MREREGKKGVMLRQGKTHERETEVVTIGVTLRQDANKAHDISNSDSVDSEITDSLRSKDRHGEESINSLHSITMSSCQTGSRSHCLTDR